MKNGYIRLFEYNPNSLNYGFYKSLTDMTNNYKGEYINALIAQSGNFTPWTLLNSINLMRNTTVVMEFDTPPLYSYAAVSNENKANATTYFYEVLSIEEDNTGTNRYVLTLSLDYYHTYINFAKVYLKHITQTSHRISDNIPYYAPEVKGANYQPTSVIDTVYHYSNFEFAGNGAFLILKIRYATSGNIFTHTSASAYFILMWDTDINHQLNSTSLLIEAAGNISKVKGSTGSYFENREAICDEAFLIPPYLIFPTETTYETQTFETATYTTGSIEIKCFKLKPFNASSAIDCIYKSINKNQGDTLDVIEIDDINNNTFIKFGDRYIKLPTYCMRFEVNLVYSFNANTFNIKCICYDDINEDVTQYFSVALIRNEQTTGLEGISKVISKTGEILGSIGAIANISNPAGIAAGASNLINAVTPQKIQAGQTIGGGDGAALFLFDNIKYNLPMIATRKRVGETEQIINYIKEYGAICDYYCNIELSDTFKKATENNLSQNIYRLIAGDFSFSTHNFIIASEITITGIPKEAAENIQTRFQSGIKLSSSIKKL